MPFRRILVCEAPYRADEGAPGRRIPCAVGVLPWTQGRPWLGVFVRTAWSFSNLVGSTRTDALGTASNADVGKGAGSDAVVPAGALVPTEGVVPHAGDPTEERPRSDDFVPLRDRADVAIVGAADFVPLPSGRLESRTMSIRFGGRTVSFIVDPPHAGKVTIRPPAARTLGDARPFDPRPRPCHDGSDASFLYDEEFDMSVCQASPRELQFDPSTHDSTGPGPLTLELEGFFASGPISLVPALEPRVILEYAESGSGAIPVPLYLDGLLVDLDAETLEVCLRGHAEVAPPADRDVDRLVLGWASPAAWREDAANAWRQALRDLPRGSFGYAWERDDALRGEAPPPLDEHELTMARYETWESLEAPEPEMELERYATITAELTEQREPRARVLARHAIDDYTWSVEERAWSQKIAVVDDDPATEALQGSYSKALADARRRLATPREKELTAAQWVELAARVQRGVPPTELAKVGLGLGAYLRLEEHWKEAAEKDPALAGELDRLREDVDRRLEEEPLATASEDEDEDEDDDGGGP